jgi:hypothetical protein
MGKKLVKEGKLVGGPSSGGTRKTKQKSMIAEFEAYKNNPSAQMSERDVNLMKTRLNSGKISMHEVDNILGDEGVLLTKEQKNKAVTWLRKQHRMLGYREQAVLGAEDSSAVKPKWLYPPEHLSAEVRLVGFYNDGYYDSYQKKFVSIFHYPIYEISRSGRSFQYYVKGGEINITG